MLFLEGVWEIIKINILLIKIFVKKLIVSKYNKNFFIDNLKEKIVC